MSKTNGGPVTTLSPDDLKLIKAALGGLYKMIRAVSGLPPDDQEILDSARREELAAMLEFDAALTAIDARIAEHKP